MGVDVLVAPYEADAQLAYLNRSKIADYIITEDSDLVLFGCRHVCIRTKKESFKNRSKEIVLDFV